ncbi:MAG: D-alanine--D-alanine ligase [Planctomycetes bacterium]|nr:D-alanine--D-alanine ligase [Planctomycetota bacterium]
MHDELVPPDSLDGLGPKEFIWFKATHDVLVGLRTLGHDVIPLGLGDEIADLRRAVESSRPHIVFNLLESFRGLPHFDQHVVSYLELLRVPYTGCNPRSLILSRDKALSKKILHYHRIRVPEFAVFPLGRKPNISRRLVFPMIVKSLVDDASTGISQASIVSSADKLVERVDFVHRKLGADAIAEQYIEGRELYVGVIGNHVLTPLPIWELKLDRLPPSTARIATERVKWDIDYQDRHEIDTGEASDLPPDVTAHCHRVSKRIYRLLGLTGYARIDFRLSPSGELYFLEANPNPDISVDEELACAAAVGGIPYENLLQKIVNLGLRRRVS